MTTHAICYSRFSPRRNASSCLSSEMQLEQCRRFCAGKGWPIESEHRDDAKSGKSTDDRAGFKAAMAAACKRGRVLVVYSLSRFSRSTKDAIDNVERLQKAGADLVSITEGLDSTTPIGRFSFRLLASMAELQRELTAEITSERMLQHQAAGRRMGSIAPYGWKAGHGGAVWVEDEFEQGNVRSILAQWRKGISPRGIAAYFNQCGVASRNGRPWSESTIRSILKRHRQP